jgi:hypothetical protein
MTTNRWIFTMIVAILAILIAGCNLKIPTAPPPTQTLALAVTSTATATLVPPTATLEDHPAEISWGADFYILE